MTPVSNNNDPHQPPTGNLEELFRQKFAEAELTPRADVWDRLDHELLLRENQGYRRRLVGYRRLAAAACAVATLGFGGWLAQRNLGPEATPNVAATSSAAAGASRLGLPTKTFDTQASQTAASVAAAQGMASGQAADQGIEQTVEQNVRRLNRATGSSATRRAFTTANAASYGAGTAGVASTDAPVVAPAGSAARHATGQLREVFGSKSAAAERQGSVASRAIATIKEVFGTGSRSVATPASSLPAAAPRGLAAEAGSTGLVAVTGFSDAAAAQAYGRLSAETMQPVAAQLQRLALGGALPDSLKPSLQNLPTASADVPTEDKKSSPLNRWQWRGGYSVQRFAPNVTSPIGNGIALRADMALAQSVAANSPGMVSTPSPTRLQPGVAQRAQVGVAVPLGKKRWTLLTGAEVAFISGNTSRGVGQKTAAATNMARSKSTLVEEKYHLTTLGIPVQMRFEERKSGWGVYATVGAAFNLLVHNRTSIDGQEIVADGSYRRAMVAARGGAGVRYSPAGGQWQLRVGPEAETSLTTLNNDPAQVSWSQRTRPYAVGLAASMEFGGGKTELAPDY